LEDKARRGEGKHRFTHVAQTSINTTACRSASRRRAALGSNLRLGFGCGDIRLLLAGDLRRLHLGR
jgi:hypothetical protein